MSIIQLVRAAGSGLALAAVAASPIAASASDAQPTAPQSSEQQIVVRDAATGDLRAATPDEANTLKSGAAVRTLRVAPKQTLPRYHASGARGARLTDEFMTYSVMVKQPDGSLLELCFESKEAAQAALKGGSLPATTAAKQTLPTE